MDISAIRTFRVTGTIGCSCGAETPGPPTEGGLSPCPARGSRFELSAVYRLVAAAGSPSGTGRAEADRHSSTEATAITPPVLRSPNVTVRPLSASAPLPQDVATQPET